MKLGVSAEHLDIVQFERQFLKKLNEIVAIRDVCELAEVINDLRSLLLKLISVYARPIAYLHILRLLRDVLAYALDRVDNMLANIESESNIRDEGIQARCEPI